MASGPRTPGPSDSLPTSTAPQDQIERHPVLPSPHGALLPALAAPQKSLGSRRMVCLAVAVARHFPGRVNQESGRGSSPGSAVNPWHDLEQGPHLPFSVHFLFCKPGMLGPLCSHLREVGRRASGWARDTGNSCPQHLVASVENHKHQTAEPDGPASGPCSLLSGSDLGTSPSTAITHL